MEHDDIHYFFSNLDFSGLQVHTTILNIVSERIHSNRMPPSVQRSESSSSPLIISMTTRCIRASLRETRSTTSRSSIASGDSKEVRLSRPRQNCQNSQVNGHVLHSISFAVRFSNSPIEGINATKVSASTAHGRKRIPNRLRNMGTL